MTLRLLPVLAGIALLCGCAGTKSTFECGATAGDECMTMLQANEKAAMKTVSKRGGGARQLPTLAERPRDVPAAGVAAGGTPRTPIPVVTTPAAATPSTSGRMLSGSERAGLVTPAPTPSAATAPRPVERPLRLPEGTGRIWVAAWVDNAGAYHADNLISVITREGEWN